MNNKNLKNLFLFLISIAAPLFFAEIALQIIKPTVALRFMPEKVVGNFIIPSNLTEFTLKNNFKGKFIKTSAPFESVVETNSIGWRDNEPDHREKILFIGGSFAFGYGLNNGETIADNLEIIDNQANDFINLGFAAGATPYSNAN